MSLKQSWSVLFIEELEVSGRLGLEQIFSSELIQDWTNDNPFPEMVLVGDPADRIVPVSLLIVESFTSLPGLGN